MWHLWYLIFNSGLNLFRSEIRENKIKEIETRNTRSDYKNNRLTMWLLICSMVIIGGGSGISICAMHWFRCNTHTPGRILHSASWTIDLSRKNSSILSRHSHNHGLPSMRMVLSILRCDNSSTDRQSRSLSRKSSVCSRGNMRKTSGSTYTKPHLEQKNTCTCMPKLHINSGNWF